MNLEKLFMWLSRIFTYFVPSGIALYTFLITKLIDKDVSLTAKIGVSGIFVLVIVVIIAIYFLGKHFRKKLAKINDEILVCIDNSKKIELINKRKKVEAKQEMFHNAIFLAPFLICYLIVFMIEKSMLDMRGTLFFVCASMVVGFGFNGVKQWLYTKESSANKGNENIEKFEDNGR